MQLTVVAPQTFEVLKPQRSCFNCGAPGRARGRASAIKSAVVADLLTWRCKSSTDPDRWEPLAERQGCPGRIGI